MRIYLSPIQFFQSQVERTLFPVVGSGMLGCVVTRMPALEYMPLSQYIQLERDYLKDADAEVCVVLCIIYQEEALMHRVSIYIQWREQVSSLSHKYHIFYTPEESWKRPTGKRVRYSLC